MSIIFYERRTRRKASGKRYAGFGINAFKLFKLDRKIQAGSKKPRLKDRIGWFREEIDWWVERAEESDLTMVVNYISKNRGKLLTLELDALRDNYPPYTKNKEEREMREIAYRAKRIDEN